MGRLSPCRDNILFGIAVLALFLMPNYAAPVQENSVSRYANDKGCFFMNKHYPSGHEIDTNEPCLNCTCVGSTLMCYLRVCPFIKPLGENCKSEMHVGDCCPKYWCPEVYPRITTEKPEIEPKGCYLHGRYYEEGARIPMDPMKPCEACYCIRNTSVCTLQKCELDIDGCYPQYKVGSCCPSRYNCTDEAATTIPPGVLDEDEIYEGCKVDGVLYKDGEHVPSEDKCKNCYCMKHEVVCAIEECTPPAPSCVPQETPEGQCCPEKYDCPPGTEIPDYATTHMVTTEEELLNLTTTSEMLQTKLTTSSLLDISEEDITSIRGAETMYPTTKGVRRIDEVPISTISTLEGEVSISTISTQEAEVSTTQAVSTMTDSRPRVPKITEVPDEMFTTLTVPNITTRRPVFYPSRPIPGEGVCRHENRTYQNKENVESLDPCRVNCTCLNSVINCDLIECILVRPESGVGCKVKKKPDECCPKYVCDIPPSKLPENETETPQQQEIVDAFPTTPKVKQQEIITDVFETSTASEVSPQITVSHKPVQETTTGEITSTLITEPPKLDQEEVTIDKISTTVLSKLPQDETTTESLEMSKETETPQQEVVSVTAETTKAPADAEKITKPVSTLIATATEKSDIRPQFDTDITDEMFENKTTVVEQAETSTASISTVKTTIETEIKPQTPSTTQETEIKSQTPSTTEEKVETSETLEAELSTVSDTKITSESTIKETLPTLKPVTGISEESTVAGITTISSTLKAEEETGKITTEVSEMSTTTFEIKTDEGITSEKTEAEKTTFSTEETTPKTEFESPETLVTDVKEISERETTVSEITPAKGAEDLTDEGLAIDQTGVTSSDIVSSQTPGISDQVSMSTLSVTAEAETEKIKTTIPSKEETSDKTSIASVTDTMMVSTEETISKAETTMQTIVTTDGFDKDETKLTVSTEGRSESTVLSSEVTTALPSLKDRFPTMSTDVIEKITTTTEGEKGEDEMKVTSTSATDLPEMTSLEDEITTGTVNVSSSLTTFEPTKSETPFETTVEEISDKEKVTMTTVKELVDKATSEAAWSSPEFSTVASTSHHEISTAHDISETTGEEKVKVFTTEKTKEEATEIDLATKEGLQTTTLVDELKKTTEAVKPEDIKTETPSQEGTSFSSISDKDEITGTTEILITDTPVLNITSFTPSETKETSEDFATHKVTSPEDKLVTETLITEAGVKMTPKEEKDDVESVTLSTAELSSGVTEPLDSLSSTSLKTDMTKQEVSTPISKEETTQTYSTVKEESTPKLKTTGISLTDETEMVTSSLLPESMGTKADVSTTLLDAETETDISISDEKEIITVVSTSSEKDQTLKPVTTEVPSTPGQKDITTAIAEDTVKTSMADKTTVQETLSSDISTKEPKLPSASVSGETDYSQLDTSSKPPVSLITESILDVTKTSEILSSVTTSFTPKIEETTTKPKTFAAETESSAAEKITTEFSTTKTLVSETVPYETISTSIEELTSEVSVGSTAKDETIFKETTVLSTSSVSDGVTDLTSTEEKELTELQTKTETLSPTVYTPVASFSETEKTLTTPTEAKTMLPEKETQTPKVTSEIITSTTSASTESEYSTPTAETQEDLRTVSTVKPALTDSSVELKTTSEVPDTELDSRGTTIKITTETIVTDAEKSSFEPEITAEETQKTGTEEPDTKLRMSTASISQPTEISQNITATTIMETITSLRTDAPVSSAEPTTTEEIEISTDNIFTTIKHTPESLIRDKTTIREEDTTTYTPLSKSTDIAATTELLESSSQEEETQEAETSTPKFLTTITEISDYDVEDKTRVTEETSSDESVLTEKSTVPTSKTDGTVSIDAVEKSTTEMPFDVTKEPDTTLHTKKPEDIRTETTKSETLPFSLSEKTDTPEITELGISTTIFAETQTMTTERTSLLEEEIDRSAISVTPTEISEESTTSESEKVKTDEGKDRLATKDITEEVRKSTFEFATDVTESVKTVTPLYEEEGVDVDKTEETFEKFPLTTKTAAVPTSVTETPVTRLITEKSTETEFAKTDIDLFASKTPADGKLFTTESSSFSTGTLGLTETEIIPKSSATTELEISKPQTTETLAAETTQESLTTQYISTSESSTISEITKVDKFSEVDHFETSTIPTIHEEVETQTKQDITTEKDIKPMITSEHILTVTEPHDVSTQPEQILNATELADTETSTVVFLEEKTSTPPSDIQEQEKSTVESEVKETETSAKVTMSSTVSEFEFTKETKTATQTTLKDMIATSTVIALTDESEKTTLEERPEATKISFEEPAVTVEGKETTSHTEIQPTTLFSLPTTEEKATSFKETTEEEVKITLLPDMTTESVTISTIKTEKISEQTLEAETSTLSPMTASVSTVDSKISTQTETKQETDKISTASLEPEEETTVFKLSTPEQMPEKFDATSTVESRTTLGVTSVTTHTEDKAQSQQATTTMPSKPTFADETTSPTDYLDATKMTLSTELHEKEFVSTVTTTSEDIKTVKDHTEDILTSTVSEKAITEIQEKETKVSSTETIPADIDKEVSRKPMTTIETLTDRVTTASVLEDELKSTKIQTHIITDHTLTEEQTSTLEDSESTSYSEQAATVSTSIEVESKPTKFTDKPKNVSEDFTEQYETETVSEEFPSTFITIAPAFEDEERKTSTTSVTHEEISTSSVTGDFGETKLTTIVPIVSENETSAFVDKDLTSQFTTVSHIPSETSERSTTETSSAPVDQTEVFTSSSVIDSETTKLSIDMVNASQTEFTDKISTVAVKDILLSTTDQTLKDTDKITTTVAFDKELEANVSTIVTVPSPEAPSEETAKPYTPTSLETDETRTTSAIEETDITTSETEKTSYPDHEKSDIVTEAEEITTEFGKTEVVPSSKDYEETEMTLTSLKDHLPSDASPSSILTSGYTEELTTESKRETTTSLFELPTKKPELIPTTSSEIQDSESTSSSVGISETSEVEESVSITSSEPSVSTEAIFEKSTVMEEKLTAKDEELPEKTTAATGSSEFGEERSTIEISTISEQETYSPFTPKIQVTDKVGTEEELLISDTEVPSTDAIVSPESAVKVTETTGIFEISSEKTEASEVSETGRTTTVSPVSKQTFDMTSTAKTEFEFAGTETEETRKVTEKTLIHTDRTKPYSFTETTETSEIPTKAETPVSLSTDKGTVFVTHEEVTSSTSLTEKEIAVTSSVSPELSSETEFTEHLFTTTPLESQTAEDDKVSKEFIDVDKSTLLESVTESVTFSTLGKATTLKADTLKPELQTAESVSSTDATKESTQTEEIERITTITSDETETPPELIKSVSTDAESFEAETVTTEFTTKPISHITSPEVSTISTKEFISTSIDAKELTSERDTEESHVTTDAFKVTSSPLEKETTISVSAETQSTVSAETMKTDIYEFDLASTTKPSIYEKTTERETGEEVSSTKMEITHSTILEESFTSDVTTPPYPDNETEISTTVSKTKATGDEETFSTLLTTKSIESSEYSAETMDAGTEPTDISKKVTTTSDFAVDVVTELSSYSPEVTTKISADTEGTQTEKTISTSLKEFSETPTAVEKVKDETMKTTISLAETKATDEKDETTTEFVTTPGIPEISKETPSDMFKENVTTTLIEDKDKIPPASTAPTFSTFTEEESEKTTPLKAFEGETTEHSPEPTPLTIDIKTDKLYPEIPDTSIMTESSTVTETKPTDSVLLSTAVESNITVFEAVSTSKPTTKDIDIETVRPSTDTTMPTFLDELSSTTFTLSDISKTELTKIIIDEETSTPLKPSIVTSTTEKPDITISDDKTRTTITEKPFEISTKTATELTPEKDFETTEKIITKPELPVSITTETRTLYTTDLLDTTAPGFTGKEPEISMKPEISTFEAETTSPSTITEHTIITEETILSNVTFAVDAMIGTQRTTLPSTSFPASNYSTTSIVSESVSEFISTMTPPSTDLLKTSISQTGLPQGIDTKDSTSESPKLETTSFASLSTDGSEEAITQTMPKETTDEKLLTVTKGPITTEFTESVSPKSTTTSGLLTDKTIKTTEMPISSTSESIEIGISETTLQSIQAETVTDVSLDARSSTTSGTVAVSDETTISTISEKTDYSSILPAITEEEMTVKDKVLTTEKIPKESEETTFSPIATGDDQLVSTSTMSRPQEAETEPVIPFSSTMESKEISSLKTESPFTTVSEKDEKKIFSPEATEPTKFTDETTTAVDTEKELPFTSVMITANATTTSEDQETQTPETEKDATLKPKVTVTTLQPLDSSDLDSSSYSDLGLPEGVVSRRDEKPDDDVTTEIATDLLTETVEYSSPSISDETKTSLDTMKDLFVNASTTEEMSTKVISTTESQITDRVTEETLTEGTSKITPLVRENITEVSTDTDSKMHTTEELQTKSTPTKQTEVSEELEAFTETLKTSAPAITTEITEEFTTKLEEKVTATTPEGISEKVTLRATEGTEIPYDFEDTSDKDIEKITSKSTTTSVSDTKIEDRTTMIDITGSTSIPHKTEEKFMTTSKFEPDVTETEMTKLEKPTTTEILDHDVSVVTRTPEKSLETESTSSTATTVSSDIITESIPTLKPILTTEELIKIDITPETTATDQKITTERPSTEVKDDCLVNGTSYKDAEAIKTIDPCEKCHCSSGDIVCFKILCKLPKEGCIPNFSDATECCPSSFECPEDDESKLYTTVKSPLEITEKDLSTPIPISFMFSTIPTSIASTMLITKLDESMERTTQVAEAVTEEKPKTATDRDMISTVKYDTSMGTYTEPSEETRLDEEVIISSTKQPGTQIPHLISETTVSFAESSEAFTPSISTEESKPEGEVSETTEKVSTVRDITTSKEYDFASTSEEPIEVSEKGTAISVDSEPDTTTAFVETTTRKETMVTTLRDEKISETTKQATETPTTFDTIKTTFAFTRDDKEETTLASESTTVVSPVTDIKMTTKVSEPVSDIKITTEISEPVTDIKMTTEVSESVTDIKMATKVSEPATDIEMTTKVSEPVTDIKMTTEVSESVTDIKMATKESEPVTKFEMTTKVSEPVTDIKMATKVSEPVTDVEMTTKVSESVTDVEMTTKVSEPMTGVEMTTKVSELVTDVEMTTKVSEPVADVEMTTKVSEPVTDVKMTTKVSEPVTDVEITTKVSEPVTDAKMTTKVLEPVTDVFKFSDEVSTIETASEDIGKTVREGFTSPTVTASEITSDAEEKEKEIVTLATDSATETPTPEKEIEEFTPSTIATSETVTDIKKIEEEFSSTTHFVIKTTLAVEKTEKDFASPSTTVAALDAETTEIFTAPHITTEIPTDIVETSKEVFTSTETPLVFKEEFPASTAITSETDLGVKETEKEYISSTTAATATASDDKVGKEKFTTPRTATTVLHFDETTKEEFISSTTTTEREIDIKKTEAGFLSTVSTDETKLSAEKTEETKFTSPSTTAPKTPLYTAKTEEDLIRFSTLITETPLDDEKKEEELPSSAVFATETTLGVEKTEREFTSPSTTVTVLDADKTEKFTSPTSVPAETAFETEKVSKEVLTSTATSITETPLETEIDKERIPSPALTTSETDLGFKETEKDEFASSTAAAAVTASDVEVKEKLTTSRIATTEPASFVDKTTKEEVALPTVITTEAELEVKETEKEFLSSTVATDETTLSAEKTEAEKFTLQSTTVSKISDVTKAIMEEETSSPTTARVTDSAAEEVEQKKTPVTAATSQILTDTDKTETDKFTSPTTEITGATSEAEEITKEFMASTAIASDTTLHTEKTEGTKETVSDIDKKEEEKVTSPAMVTTKAAFDAERTETRQFLSTTTSKSGLEVEETKKGYTTPSIVTTETVFDAEEVSEKESTSGTAVDIEEAERELSLSTTTGLEETTPKITSEVSKEVSVPDMTTVKDSVVSLTTSIPSKLPKLDDTFTTVSMTDFASKTTETTESDKEVTTLSPLTPKVTSLDRSTVTDSKVFPESSTSIIPESTLDTKQSVSEKERTEDEDILGTLDYFTDTFIISQPTVKTPSDETDMTTEYEVITEILEGGKTISIRDREGTVSSPKPVEISTISTLKDIPESTSLPMATELKQEEKELTESTTSSGVTDKIFTFVTTRFTDITKEIPESTTPKLDKETASTTVQELSTVGTFKTTEKTDERITHLIPLTRRIDIEFESTTEEQTTQESETTETYISDISTTEKPRTKPIIVEETLSTKADRIPEDILTTIASIITTQKTERDSVTSEPEIDVTREVATKTVNDSDVADVTKEDISISKSTFTEKISTLSSETEMSSEETEKPTDISEVTVSKGETDKPSEVTTGMPIHLTDVTSTAITTEKSSSAEETLKTVEELVPGSTVGDSVASITEKRATDIYSSIPTSAFPGETLTTLSPSKETSDIIEDKTESTITEATEKQKSISPSDIDQLSRGTRKDVELETTPVSFSETVAFSTEKVTELEVETSARTTSSTAEEFEEEKEKTSDTRPSTFTSTTVLSEMLTEPTETSTRKETELPLSSTERVHFTESTTKLLSQTDTFSITPMEIQTEVPKTTSPEILPVKDIEKVSTAVLPTRETLEDVEVSSSVQPDKNMTTRTDASSESTSVSEDELKGKEMTTLEYESTFSQDYKTTSPEFKRTYVFEEVSQTTEKEFETSTTVIREDLPKSSISVTEKESTPSETVKTTFVPKVTTVEQEAETVTDASVPEKSSTYPETPEQFSTTVSTLATRKGLEDNATEILTKGFKAIETTPIPLSTTHPSIRDGETTTLKPEEDYLIDENTCIFEGRVYQSAEQIPRSDPCEFCFCFRGDIICLQQSCPPPAANCHQTMIPGYCCPRYECPVYVTSKNITQFSRRKGVSPIIIQRRIDKREIRPTIEVKGCQVNGTFYEMGKTVTSASGPCLHCVCQEDGLMHCDPQRCKIDLPMPFKMNNSVFRRR